MSTPPLAYIGHDRFVADVRALAALLKGDDWRPDFLVGIGRGGLTPAVYLSHATGIPLLSVDHSSHVPTFGDELLARLAASTATGTRILIVDDINDSGRTLAYLRKAIAAAGGDAPNLRFAVLIDNIRSIETVDYRARTIDRDEEKSWFVFPWEAMADREDALVEAAIVHNQVA
ncbi:MAG: phosphoribosyltransferase [Sphingomonas sanxanigenens]|uniref:Phosphoribosyltransferase n=1 Tax=Sphingomonas sanxanigenens TaxID=397260 RepID=A0A2W5BYL5_9SPHN|nr:MAG: phosphoribosyltransferase [Sphingomonas sanxanigenens]